MVCLLRIYIEEKRGVSWFWLLEYFMLRSKYHSLPRMDDMLTRNSLWAIKYSTSMFLRTLTESVWKRQHQKLLRYLHIFLGLTFLATVVADLGACQPFSHYWQVVPDPGPACRTGSAHLYTMGVLNIVTNLVLIIFPIPIIWKAKISRRQKASIMVRLALPLLSIA